MHKIPLDLLALVAQRGPSYADDGGLKVVRCMDPAVAWDVYVVLAACVLALWIYVRHLTRPKRGQT